MSTSKNVKVTHTKGKKLPMAIAVLLWEKKINSDYELWIQIIKINAQSWMRDYA